jgi:hypothetical protein
MPPRQTKDVGKAHRFGGNWSTARFDVIAQYLHGYMTALKDKPREERPFRKAYIDAFAGTGYREERREEEKQTQQGLPFPDLAERETKELIEGSAKLALRAQPRFDKYIWEWASTGCLQNPATFLRPGAGDWMTCWARQHGSVPQNILTAITDISRLFEVRYGP